MQIFHSLDEIPAAFGEVIATIGNFDGVHRGHRWVIDEVIARARQLGLRSLALTFDPHPARVLRPDAAHELIMPLAQKLACLGTTGIDATLVLPFTPELRCLTAECFARDILRNGVHAREIHEGENFRFGQGASAGIEGLTMLGRQVGFDVTAYAPCVLRGAPVSSSRVRTLIREGRVSAARALLGRPFSLVSTPAAGRGFGTRYTVPTINLAPYPELLPANGVYITTLTVGQGEVAECFEAVTNVGNRPTFGADSFTVDSHLAADTRLELAFLHRLRDERRFNSPDALRTQIGLDVRLAERFFHLASILKR
jgi:riboflavin kinase/FMN adenylyltransferase